MKVNHDATKAKIISIKYNMEELASAAKKYRNDAQEILQNGRMSQSFQNERIAELRADYYAKHESLKGIILEKLNDVQTLEIDTERICELDVPEFANTIAAINAAQGKLHPDVMEGIKLNFAGQYQALQTIAAAFDRYEVNLEKHGYGEYLSSAAVILPDIIDYADNMEQDKTVVLVSLSTLFKKIIRFGETRGIHFTDNEKAFDALDDDARDIMARQAMGLPV